MDKRYWPRIVRFPYSLGRVIDDCKSRFQENVLNGEEVKDFQRKIGQRIKFMILDESVKRFE